MFVKTNGCYCVALYQPFDPSTVPVLPAHNCCSNCKEGCRCEECVEGRREELPFENKKSDLNISTPVVTRPVSDDDKEVLKAALTEITQGQDGNAFGPVMEHCFSPELIEDIVNKCHQLFSIQDIIEHDLPVYSIAHCLKILEIIQENFKDIPNLDAAVSYFTYSINVCKQVDFEYDNYFIDVFDSTNDETDELETI